MPIDCFEKPCLGNLEGHIHMYGSMHGQESMLEDSNYPILGDLEALHKQTVCDS
jgi:hypothetical protein